MMTVKEVSNLTGVSIRTLQYYDKIGLLHPAHRTQAGYRLYDDAALERLQQILLFRELEFSLEEAQEMRITIPETMKYFCVIETIALYIQKYTQYRKRKIFFGNSGKIDNLIPTMVKHKDEKYLVPLSSVHTHSIGTMLTNNKLKHKECVMYRTISNDLTEEEKKTFDYDMLVFFSPTGVRALKENLPDFEQGNIKIAAFGPATAKEVKDQGLRLDLEAPSAKYPSMTGALRAFLEEQKK